MTEWPGGLLHVLNILCLLLLSFLCHLSYHSTNPSGPSKQRGRQPSCLTVVHFYMRLKTRPCSGHSHRDADHVHSYSILLWPRGCGKDSHLSSSGFCSSD